MGTSLLHVQGPVFRAVGSTSFHDCESAQFGNSLWLVPRFGNCVSMRWCLYVCQFLELIGELFIWSLLDSRVILQATLTRLNLVSFLEPATLSRGCLTNKKKRTHDLVQRVCPIPQNFM